MLPSVLVLVLVGQVWSGPCLSHLVAVSSLGALDMFGSDALICPCGQRCGGPRAEGQGWEWLRGKNSEMAGGLEAT